MRLVEGETDYERLTQRGVIERARSIFEAGDETGRRVMILRKSLVGKQRGSY